MNAVSCRYGSDKREREHNYQTIPNAINLILFQSNFVFVFSLFLKSTFKFDNIADFGELLHFECIHIDKQNKENSTVEIHKMDLERDREMESAFLCSQFSFILINLHSRNYTADVRPSISFVLLFDTSVRLCVVVVVVVVVSEDTQKYIPF